MNSVST